MVIGSGTATDKVKLSNPMPALLSKDPARHKFGQKKIGSAEKDSKLLF
jgi:hypothetical protein